MVLPNKARVYRRRRPIELERKSRKIDRLPQGGSRAKGPRVGDDLVTAFEEMAKHLRGEIELEMDDLPSGAMTPAQIKAVRLKVAILRIFLIEKGWYRCAGRVGVKVSQAIDFQILEGSAQQHVRAATRPEARMNVERIRSSSTTYRHTPSARFTRPSPQPGHGGCCAGWNSTTSPITPAGW